MNIKLSKDADLTRRIHFAQNPSWIELSSKISELYAIPQTQVAVGYTDPADGDIVTISSDIELAEYLASIGSVDLVRLIVQDLGVFRSQESAVFTPYQGPFLAQ